MQALNQSRDQVFADSEEEKHGLGGKYFEEEVKAIKKKKKVKRKMKKKMKKKKIIDRPTRKQDFLESNDVNMIEVAGDNPGTTNDVGERKITQE